MIWLVWYITMLSIYKFLLIISGIGYIVTYISITWGIPIIMYV